MSPSPQSIQPLRTAAPIVFGCTASNAGHDATWVHVTGELDIATAPQLERTLRQAQDRDRLTVLDLRELTFMDSAGVHTIVNATTAARRIGQRLILIRGIPRVERVFVLAAVLETVEIVDLDSAASAIEALRAQPPRSVTADSALSAYSGR